MLVLVNPKHAGIIVITIRIMENTVMEEIYVVAEDLLGNFILCGYEIDDKEFI
jgi:hypothetical protein